MSRIEGVESDLRYVRSVLERAEECDSPPAIYFLWAAISLVGFALYDFRPEWSQIYWPIMGPLGGVASFLLGWSWSRRVGQSSRRVARYHALHWLGMMAAVFLAVPLHVSGLMGEEALARVILLIITLGYFTAGIYLVRSYLWVGVVMAAGYFALFFFRFGGHSWTVIGLLIAISLTWAGWRGASREPQAE